jgi:fucose permease
MNAIMFSTIFSLTSEKLLPRTVDGSGVIIVVIFGGAVISPAIPLETLSTESVADPGPD